MTRMLFLQYSITTMLFERTRIRLSTMYPFFRSFAIARDMFPNHDMLYAQFWSGFTFIATLGSLMLYNIHQTRLCVCVCVYAHSFIPFSLHHYIISELPHKRAHTNNSNNTNTNTNNNNTIAITTTSSTIITTTRQNKKKIHPM